MDKKPVTFDDIADDFFAAQGRTRCCREDYGGSHYHCANCGRPGGMYGCIDKGRLFALCPPESEREAWWKTHVVV